MHPFRTINRSIVTKTVTLIFGVVCVLILALILTSRELVLKRFASLEEEDAKVQVQRVVNEIRSTLDKLQTFGTDWGYWDDTFQFVVDHNPEFIENNLMNETFIDQRLNFMMFFNAQGQLVHQQFFNLINAKPAEPDISTVATIQALPQLVHNDHSSLEVYTGVILTPTAPLLLISSPVIPSLRNQPSRGRFLIGRYLNRDEIDRISTLTQLNLAVIPLPPPSSITGQRGTGHFLTETVNDNTLLASTVLVDIFGQPNASVQVTLPRTIFRQGYAMWKQHAVSAALLGFFFVVVLVLLLNRIVLQRLVRMIGEIDRIKEKGDPGQSVTVQGQDEIAYLAEKINSMLETLQRLSQSQEEKEHYLRRVLDTINCGVMVVDAEDRQIVTINKAGAALLGHHPDDIIGQICHTFVCPRDHNDCPVLDHNERIDLSERLLIHADHSELPVLKSVASIENGGKRYLIESFVDISPLKQAEAELRLSEARYRQFFDEDLTGDFIVSAAGEIIDCNLAYARMFGYETIDEIKRTNVVTQYASGADREIFLDRIRREGKLVRYESELRRRDGRPLYCIGNEIGEFDEQGELVRIRGYLFDDTKRVLLERDIRQNQKMEAIGTLAGGIAHDFNNILAGIIGYAEIILIKESADSRVREYLRKILAAGEKARELIYQILAFSRKTETTLQPVQLEPVVREVMQLLRATLPSTITMEDQLNSKATVLADPVQIHQIVLNLCTNAGHAMRERGGTLSVALEDVTLDQAFVALHPTLPLGDYVRIRISDTGHGIPVALHDRIFDPFFTTKSKDEGTGLGLSVVHGIVQNLNGLISLESTPGQGTKFDIYLHRSLNAADEVLLADVEAPTSGEEHIVYVDDDPFLVEIGREILLDLGYRVTEFTDSLQALAFLNTHHPEVDLVISDMTMPGLTGIALARSLHDIGARTPMIIYTGYKEDLSGENLDRLNIRRILLKPITPQVLASKVREVLDEVQTKP
ncbi:CHASE4 domain-containing protein [uncultured Desulfobulbus sp.]|uniref:CHASE4 domain-containing protein n=1 Tax=uncultured Desulfobulbus sp. TaxID=239745 RepID=UPI0029C84A69|nr:CHASE4 domain-containing protein [uncultured Desulfobulbus sp.]